MAVPLNGRPATRHLIVFLKMPRVGRVKRRLACDIGLVDAWAFYRRTTESLTRRLARDPRWRTWLAVTPDAAMRQGRLWPHDAVMEQGRGDIGTRMYRALCAPPPGPTVLIGGDIPDATPDHVAAAFRLLGSHDLVFGPAEDGGFWLVGARRAPRFPYPFSGVRWSHPHTLSDTLSTLDPRQRVARGATLMDVDDGAALAAWRFRRRAASRAPGAAA